MPTATLKASTIHYAQRGAGAPAIVMVHGALCTHDDWRFQIAHFARRHQVVAPDLHGHGGSGRVAGRIRVEVFADELEQLCQLLQLDKIVLVGHSMGCRVLLQTWRIAPQRVAAMVFVDGAYLVPGLLGDIPGAQRQAMATAAYARAAAVYDEVDPAERARHGFARMFFDSQFEAMRDTIVQRAVALPGMVARELMPDFAAWDVLHMEQVLPTVTVPVLAIACTHMNEHRVRVRLQPGVVTPWLAALERYLPHATIVRPHGAGHFPMLEQPDTTNQTIDRFLAQHRLGAADSEARGNSTT